MQLTLLAMGLAIATLAYNGARVIKSLGPLSEVFGTAGSSGWTEVGALLAVSLVCFGTAAWMGVRTIRGPEPPSLG